VRANRFLVYLGFVAAMILPAIYARRARQMQDVLLLVASLFGLTILGLAIRFGNVNGNYPYKSDFPEVFSIPMIHTLTNANLRGAVFTSYDLGAELTYRAYPRMQASIDSRIDSYGDDYFFFHEQLLDRAEMMDMFVIRYNVRYMLLTNSDFRKFQKLSLWQSGQWLPMVVDTRAVLLGRKEATPSP
jgi:hypothetical protein